MLIAFPRNAARGRASSGMEVDEPRTPLSVRAKRSGSFTDRIGHRTRLRSKSLMSIITEAVGLPHAAHGQKGRSHMASISAPHRHAKCMRFRFGQYRVG